MEIELRQVIRAALRWAWLIVLITVLGGGLAFVFTKGQTATYSATTTILVNPQQVVGSSDSSVLAASRSQAETYVRLVDTGPVLNQVIEDLDLSLTRKELAAKIEASTVMNTQLIEITVTDPSPDEAARIANAISDSFQARVDELTTGHLQDNLQQAITQTQSLQNRIEEINAKLSDLDTDANRDNAEIQDEIATLKEERTRAQETIADLDSTIRSINSALAIKTSPVEVADSAQPAREPDSPKPILMTALGLFLGLLVGCGLAAILEITDRKVRPDTDVEALTDARLLSIVPMDGKNTGVGQPVVTAQPDSATSEAIRLLRTHLQDFVDKHPHGSLVVANASSGNKKSAELLASLGVTFAESGTSTLLVDANLRTPYLHEVFGASNDRGAASLVESAEASGAAQDIAPGLQLVSSGAATGHPAAVVNSSAFGSMLSKLSSQVDLTLVNTPPALEYSDALGIASIADGVLVVGRYGVTERDDLSALVSTIREDGMNVVGIVMIRA